MRERVILQVLYVVSSVEFAFCLVEGVWCRDIITLALAGCLLALSLRTGVEIARREVAK